MRLVLLPALDGTGEMFANLQTALADHFDTMVIAYPQTGPQDYSSLADYIRQQIPDSEPYMLLGESFAGPLVHNIAAADPEHCKAAIFVATYLSNPRPVVIKLLTLTPARLINFFVARPGIVALFGLSRQASLSTIRAVAANLARHPTNTFKQRLQAIGQQTAPAESRLTLPCLYIKARNDKLVLNNKLSDFKRLCADLDIQTVNGGHFILQESPGDCANILIEKFSTANQGHRTPDISRPKESAIPEIA